jgi:transcriptional pleiotropic regulator of transition state genes
MKSTGIVRKIDELGRIVLPVSIRQTMGISEKDSLEIFTDENRIILQKYEPSCIFCTNADNVVLFHGKRICEDCLKKIKEAF